MISAEVLLGAGVGVGFDPPAGVGFEVEVGIDIPERDTGEGVDGEVEDGGREGDQVEQVKPAEQLGDEHGSLRVNVWVDCVGASSWGSSWGFKLGFTDQKH